MNNSENTAAPPLILEASFRRKALLLLSFLAVGIKALPMMRFPLGGDHAVFLTLGQCVLDGGVLYQDCWDTTKGAKPFSQRSHRRHRIGSPPLQVVVEGGFLPFPVSPIPVLAATICREPRDCF